MSDALTEAQAAVAPEGYVMEPWQRGFGRTIGPLYIRQDPDGGYTTGFRVEAHHANGLNNCHGGMMASIADMAWGRVGMRFQGDGWVTVRLMTDFLSGARMGEWIEASSDLIWRDGDLFSVRGRLWAGERTLMTGTAVFKVVAMDPKVMTQTIGFSRG